MIKKQSGSAHVVIIIVLVVALLGALGFVFYQNFLGGKKVAIESAVSTKPTTSTPKADEVKTKTLAMNTVFANGLSASYPEKWTVAHETPQGDIPPVENGTTSDRYTLTSPDGTVSISLSQLAGGGFGGACNPDEMPTLSTYSYEGSSVWNTKSYVDFINPYNGEFSVSQILADTSKAKAISAGDSVCEASFLNIVDTGKVVGSDTKIYLRAFVTLKGSPNGMSYATLAEAKAYLASQNAKDIKSILLSLK